MASPGTANEELAMSSVSSDTSGGGEGCRGDSVSPGGGAESETSGGFSVVWRTSGEAEVKMVRILKEEISDEEMSIRDFEQLLERKTGQRVQSLWFHGVPLEKDRASYKLCHLVPLFDATPLRFAVSTASKNDSLRLFVEPSRNGVSCGDTLELFPVSDETSVEGVKRMIKSKGGYDVESQVLYLHNNSYEALEDRTPLYSLDIESGSTLKLHLLRTGAEEEEDSDMLTMASPPGAAGFFPSIGRASRAHMSMPLPPQPHCGCRFPSSDPLMGVGGFQTMSFLPLRGSGGGSFPLAGASPQLLGASCPPLGGMVGSSLFTDVSDDTSMVRESFSDSAPDWRVCSKGLNVEGSCLNFRQSCRVTYNPVICPVGFGPFNLMLDKARCPLCDSEITPITCGFYDCEWRFEGVKSTGKESVSSDWKLLEGEGCDGVVAAIAILIEGLSLARWLS
ncbi:hypothetical protein CBR_g31565 [Chara braunii]|uniref:Ubiquitin-like domain-containing protein n=1 Tax=Chara braunii TaxID=69332 RepID=A0A388LFB8_CHABU|nr:hypothetical protein CBR_g31565 [Chara braunii]|eukprot:GBG81009.1 hypothetical protein CBR_g31565 [Chara braunii]